MLKKYLYGGILAVIVLGLVTLYLVKKLERITPVEVLQAVPEDAILFAEGVDFEFLTESFFPENRIWIDLVNTAGLNKIDSTLSQGITHILSNETLRELLFKEGINVSLHLVGKNKIVPLFYLSYIGSYSDNEFEQFILGFLEKNAMMNERKYEAETIYDFSGRPGLIPEKFSLACVNGLCLVSPTSMLIEESIRTIHADTDLSDDRGLEMIRETAGRFVHANLYINYRKLPQLFYPVIKEADWGDLNLFSRMASWGELDLDIKEDAIILNGMSRTRDGETLFLGTFRDQAPVRMDLQEVIPSGTSYFLHLGISDPSQFMEQLTIYMDDLGKGPDMAMEMDRLRAAYGIDPLGDLAKILGDEMAWFAIEGEPADAANQVLVIETRSRSETEDMVLHWIEKYLQVNSFDMGSYLQVYQLDDQTSYRIYKLPDHYFDKLLPGRLFNTYFTIYENYLLFGPSVELLSRVIYQNVLHKTLVSDPVYKEMSDYMANRSNITLFFRPYNFLDQEKELLSERAAERIQPLEIFLRRIPGLVVQYTTEGDLYYHNVNFKYTSQIKEKALTVWESLLDSVAIIKPALVTNHNTSEKEIFVQDAARNIYLINGTGRILWKQPIEGAILGEVYQVDMFKNGKLQYLFNTREKIHLIDRNGNYVERYPVSLRAPATNGLSLFDYDNNRNYRIFLAAEDRRIYVYDIEGNVVTGWQFNKTESEVTGEIQHFRVEDRDYIVFSDRNRTYFLDRRGKERIRIREPLHLSPQNPLTVDMNIREEKPRWISTDTSGNVKAVYLDGNVSVLLEEKVTSDHFFRMQDMNSDGVPEFIFASGNELNVLHQDGSRLFSYKVRDKISDMPDIYKFSASDVKIGITDRDRNRIYLLNSDGSLYEGFPLEGSTRFSIGYFAGSDSRFNLIVGSANNFLYNYSIE
ncbi:MAG: hypothetical protein ACWGNV_10630 [Bacteroidales bacterium]